MQVTGVATCHCQLKLSRAEPRRAERPINSCAQLSHLSTQSISHNGNSRQRRLIDRAAYPSPPPSPYHATPCLAMPRRVPENRSHNPIAQLDPFDPPHRHRISFVGISIFHFGSEFVTYRPRPWVRPPSAIPGDGTEAALVLLNSSYPIALPLATPLAARYQHCSLSRKMPTKHKIYLRGQRVDGVRRGGGGVDEESLRFRFQFGTESPRLC